jgi:hypothetical protein
VTDKCEAVIFFMNMNTNKANLSQQVYYNVYSQDLQNLLHSSCYIKKVLQFDILFTIIRVKESWGSPHFLDNRLTDSGEVVSLMCRPPFTPERLLVLISVKEWVDPRAIVWRRIRPIQKSNNLIRSWTHKVQSCSMEPQAMFGLKGRFKLKTIQQYMYYGNEELNFILICQHCLQHCG